MYAMDTKQNFVNTLLERYINTTSRNNPTLRSTADVGGYFSNMLCNIASLGSQKFIKLPTGRLCAHDNIIKIEQDNDSDSSNRTLVIDQIPYTQLGVTQLYSVTHINRDTDIVFFADTRRIIAYNVATKQKLFDIAVEQPAGTQEILKVEDDGHTLRYQFKNYFPETNFSSLSEAQKSERVRRFSSKISVSLPFDIATFLALAETFITQPSNNQDDAYMQSIIYAIKNNQAITLDAYGRAFFNQLPQEIKTLITTTNLITNIQAERVVIAPVEQESKCTIQ
jgi:hypothetical protein